MTSLTRADVVTGLQLAPLVDSPLRLADIVRYQGASGDFHPLHHDAGSAHAAGFAGPVSVGMLQAGVLATYITDHFGPASVRRFKVLFLDVAWPGDVITYSALVSDVRELESEASVEAHLDLLALRNTSVTHLKGWATVVI